LFLQKPVHLRWRECSIGLRQLAKLNQFIVVNVCPILLGKQILVNPELSSPLRE